MGKFRFKTHILIALLALLFLCVLFAFAPFGTAYAEGNEQTSPPAAVEPSVFENGWLVEPSIVRWTYSDFQRTTNIIYGKPKRGEVKFSILTADGEEIDPSLSDFTVNLYGVVSSERESILKSLPVARGGYILRATVEETAEYEGLLKDYRFEVIQAVNRWLIEPQVLGWRYGEYDINLNFMTAIPAYGKESVLFFLYKFNKNLNSYLLVYLAGDGVPFFSYNEDGSFPDPVIRGLSELESGTYSLIASIPQTDNYTGLNTGVQTASRDGFIFEVAPTENRWLTTPSIVPWSWSLFDPAVNLLYAVPTFPMNAEERIVKFGIYTSAECNAADCVEGLKDFYSVSGTADGAAVQGSVEEKLKGLDAGVYYLMAEVEGNENYSPLKTVSPFTITPYKNYWSTTPTVVEWQWGEYNPEINVIFAAPAYVVGDSVVTYNIFKSDGLTLAFEQPRSGFIVDCDIEEQLSALPAGEYYLVSHYDGGRNFLGLAGMTKFSVRQFENGWLKTPTFAGFEYAGFDRNSNIIFALSIVGETYMSIYDSEGEKITFGEENEDRFKLTEDGLVPEYIAAKLNILHAGDYYLHAFVDEENANFSTLNCFTDFEDIQKNSVKFSVFKAQNGWVVAPRIYNWMRGEFDEEKNAIWAEARLATNRLHIYVYNEKGQLVVSQASGNPVGTEALRNLSAGKYTVRFEIAETANYYGLFEELELTVFEESVKLGYFIGVTVVFIVFAGIGVAACAFEVIRKRGIKFRK